jgi:N-formylglutamate deformylase
MILHVPHSSYSIPADVRDQFVLSDGELSAELLLMTDAFVDELFSWPAATVVKFPWSRLVVDVERFPEDADEPMSRMGMGIVYTRTAAGGVLRRPLQLEEKQSLMSLYEAHHQALSQQVADELALTGRALIVDCHSFPSRPLPCDPDQSTPRPQFCLGTDPLHTPATLARSVATELETMGCSVAVNQPYSGTLVPLDFWRKDRRVASMMIEINRSLYMDEATGAKSGEFGFLREQIESLLSSIREFEKQT